MFLTVTKSMVDEFHLLQKMSLPSQISSVSDLAMRKRDSGVQNTE
jgi:hypothetical protein